MAELFEANLYLRAPTGNLFNVPGNLSRGNLNLPDTGPNRLYLAVKLLNATVNLFRAAVYHSETLLGWDHAEKLRGLSKKIQFWFEKIQGGVEKIQGGVKKIHCSV